MEQREDPFAHGGESRIIVWVLVGLAFLVLCGYDWAMHQRLEALEAQVKLLRALSVGRSKEDVRQWLGEPDGVETGAVVSGREYPLLWQYRSAGLYSTRLNGPDDIWIAFDPAGRVAVVYYPDSPQDRANVERE